MARQELDLRPCTVHKSLHLIGAGYQRVPESPRSYLGLSKFAFIDCRGLTWLLAFRLLQKSQGQRVQVQAVW